MCVLPGACTPRSEKRHRTKRTNLCWGQCLAGHLWHEQTTSLSLTSPFSSGARANQARIPNQHKRSGHSFSGAWTHSFSQPTHRKGVHPATANQSLLARPNLTLQLKNVTLRYCGFPPPPDKPATMFLKEHFLYGKGCTVLYSHLHSTELGTWKNAADINSLLVHLGKTHSNCKLQIKILSTCNKFN